MSTVFLSLASGEAAACLTAVEERWGEGFRGGKRREQLKAENLGKKSMEKLKPCRYNIEEESEKIMKNIIGFVGGTHSH